MRRTDKILIFGMSEGGLGPDPDLGSYVMSSLVPKNVVLAVALMDQCLQQD